LPLEPIEDLVAPLGWGFGIALLTGTHFQKSVHSSFCIECSKH
jgi:hypothetical protein